MKYNILFLIEKFKHVIPDKIYNKLRNTVVLVKKDGTIVKNPKIKNLKIEYLGKNSKNRVTLYEPIKIAKYLKVIFMGNNSETVIKSGADVKRLVIRQYNNTKVLIGENFSSEETKITTFSSNDTSVKIGTDCMFSYGILIRTSDNHTIYNISEPDLAINLPKDIEIGNHVWICADAKIMKGAKIPNNSVVGACGLVNKKFSEENIILAGIPAKIIKRNINWGRKSPQKR